MAPTLFLFFLLAPDLPAHASREVAIGECKPVDRDEIIVCGSRKGAFDPAGNVKSVMNERVGRAAEGDSGTQSCSAVGPGGWTGCMVKSWKVERDQTQWGKNVPTRRW